MVRMSYLHGSGSKVAVIQRSVAALALAIALFLGSCVDAVAQLKGGTPKVLMVVTSNDALKDGSPAGYYFPEAVECYAVLKKNGFTINDIEVVSPQGGEAPMYERDVYMNYPPFYDLDDAEQFLAKFDNSRRPSQIDPTQYSVIFYVGGFASMFDLPHDTAIASIAASIYERGGIVAAVCHGPSGLIPIRLSNGRKLIEGQTLTGRSVEEDTDDGSIPRSNVLYFFPFFLEERLIEEGVNFVKGPVGRPKVAVSERIVTGQNPASSPFMAIEILKLLAEGTSGVENGSGAGSGTFALGQNTPNPFGATTTIEYSIPVREHVRLAVYSVMGEKVLSLVDGVVDAGTHEVRLGRDLLPPGTYFYRVESAGQTAARTMIVTR